MVVSGDESGGWWCCTLPNYALIFDTCRYSVADDSERSRRVSIMVVLVVISTQSGVYLM